ncbi:KTSC domain-containing protein [Rugamonas sp.]|uniref:KTSC domain-containing protein n=1 Tax=Rugamonas sp. TaxID=1926287 RepID=UPI0025F7C0DC|nr:KTSC domain-containing protein [Rugamonas sp.]
MNANIIPLTPVNSKKIAAIGHDLANEVLAIQFLRKGAPDAVYHYQNFSAVEYAAFASAQSLGKHFGEHIQPHKDKHPYQNMGVPAAPVVVEDAAA